MSLIRFEFVPGGVKVYPEEKGESLSQSLDQKSLSHKLNVMVNQMIRNGVILRSNAKIAQDFSHYYLDFGVFTENDFKKLLRYAKSKRYKLLHKDDEQECLANFYEYQTASEKTLTESKLEVAKPIKFEFLHDGIKIYINSPAQEQKYAAEDTANEDAYFALTRILGQAVQDKLISKDNVAVRHSSENSNYCYLKFEPRLARTALRDLLKPMVKQNLLSDDLRKKCLNAYYARYSTAINELDCRIRKTDGSKSVVTKSIINFIGECKQNDVLVEIHQHLLSPKYDYLRKFTLFSRYQGTDAKGNVVSTSHSWSQIEKAIALQMEQNIKAQEQPIPNNLPLTSADELKAMNSVAKQKAWFNADPRVTLLKERRVQAAQLAEKHKFVSIRRNFFNFFKSVSTSFTAFASRDDKAFNQKYDAHFGAYKPRK